MNITSSNNINLFGYKYLFSNLIEIYKGNTLPKKIIFSGNNGIGKCTLAYHLTNYILSINEEKKYNFDENVILKNNYSYNLIWNIDCSDIIENNFIIIKKRRIKCH